jgi:predicted ArsR family transcriptional regulator
VRELCEDLDTKRQSATQHLDLLEEDDLVTVVRRGRERLHYLNPARFHEIEERWINEVPPAEKSGLDIHSLQFAPRTSDFAMVGAKVEHRKLSLSSPPI